MENKKNGRETGSGISRGKITDLWNVRKTVNMRLTVIAILYIRNYL